MAKHSSDPRVAYPEVNVLVRELVRGVGILPPLLHGEVSIWGNFVSSRNPGCKTSEVAMWLNVVLTPR